MYVRLHDCASIDTVGGQRRIRPRSTRSTALRRMSLPRLERTRPLSSRVSARFDGHSFARIRSTTLQRSAGASFRSRSSYRMNSSNLSSVYDSGLGGGGEVRVTGASGDTMKLINIYLNYASNFRNRCVVKADKKSVLRTKYEFGST